MIVERSMHPHWLSNTYLVAAGPGADGFLVDAGGPVAPLLEKARADDIAITHVLLTHHHHDHVAELAAVADRRPDDRRAGARGQRVRARLARAGGRGERAVHRDGRARDARPARRRLRRRAQGLGALARRERRHRAGLAGPAWLSDLASVEGRER